ncbi:MAG: hypothetical protein RBU37_03280 [Myxococcota bacterium]|jgi:hypothetical protein|nr:hypothetical protein [Myxococcota bacterium]
MLQAFVSLHDQQPPRTESDLQTFFEGIAGSLLSPPSSFCTNVDATVKPFSMASIVTASADPKCKFVMLRGPAEQFWQMSLVMPDKHGVGAIFFDLEKSDGSSSISIDDIDDFAKKLYKAIQPRMIRIGDSEARDKLKSRHGLVLMPGLGRIEWLQIVHPAVYAELYNPSELVAAPAYSAEIFEDGALYLRVYGDPKDWENEENISLANFIPGFLAGTANVKDGEKEKENVKLIEKLWNRAYKIAEKAYELFDAPVTESPAPEPPPEATEAPKAVEAPKPEAPKPVAVEAPKPEAPKPEAPKPEAPKPEAPKPEAPKPEEPKPEALKPEAPKPEAPKPEAPKPEAPKAKVPKVAEVREMVQSLFADSGIDKESLSALQLDLQHALFSAINPKTTPPSKVFFAYSKSEERLRHLDRLDDFAAFLQGEALGVREADQKQLVDLVRKYHRPFLQYLDATADIPEPARLDPRVADFAKQVKPPYLDESEETRQLHLWAYNPVNSSLEELFVRQYADWPITVEVKRHLDELREPSTGKAAVDAAVAEPLEQTPEAQKPVTRQRIMLLVLLFILAVGALLFIFYFKGDWHRLWSF